MVPAAPGGRLVGDGLDLGVGDAGGRGEAPMVAEVVLGPGAVRRPQGEQLAVPVREEAVGQEETGELREPPEEQGMVGQRRRDVERPAEVVQPFVENGLRVRRRVGQRRDPGRSGGGSGHRNTTSREPSPAGPAVVAVHR